jgi:hypothetical protein
MIATQEFVVPRSIPITSPASAPKEAHRLSLDQDGRRVEAAPRNDPLAVADCKDSFVAPKRLRRMLICSAMTIAANVAETALGKQQAQQQRVSHGRERIDL